MDSQGTSGTVLVVDDQKNMRTTTALLLRAAGHRVEEAGGVEEALTVLTSTPIDVVLSDLRMEPLDGMDLLRKAGRASPGTQVIMMTAYGTIESAVAAMQDGAFDYVTKPFVNQEDLLLRVQRALERRRLLSQVSLMSDEFRRRNGLNSIVGTSEVMRKLGGQISRAANSEATVLVTGDSGTGKELVARAVHALSKRSERPFVSVNCAAMTETLLDSELFGHVKGAFTGAFKARRGLFEEAEGGTLFIDEITETTLGFQAKLLRAIQEHEVRRVGESVPIRVDVRLVAASNRDLAKAVADKTLREDLYYRLNVIPLRVPPLRERLEDVPLLAQYFLQRHNERTGANHHLSIEAIRHLCAWSYPGNVRELENLIERAAALAEDEILTPNDFPLLAPSSAGTPAPVTAIPAGSVPRALADVVDDAERLALTGALARHGGDLAEVAHELGISSTTLWRKMKRHNLTR